VVPKHSNPAALPYEGPGWFRDQETVAAGDRENILEAISFSTLPNNNAATLEPIAPMRC